MRILYWIVVAPIMLIAVLFAISNRQTVMLGLWPLHYEISVPVYLIAMLPLAAGFIAGGMVAWNRAGKARARARAGNRQINAEEREIAALDLKRGGWGNGVTRHVELGCSRLIKKKTTQR